LSRIFRWSVDLRGDRSLTLRYVPHNRVPLDKGRREVLKHVHRLWGFDVLLEQQNADGSWSAARRARTRCKTIKKCPTACRAFFITSNPLTHADD
jgi:spore cortex formation protein SpoVR/YcgB (stage V sporulation)